MVSVEPEKYFLDVRVRLAFLPIFVMNSTNLTRHFKSKNRSHWCQDKMNNQDDGDSKRAKSSDQRSSVPKCRIT